jgi:hypothetical protein
MKDISVTLGTVEGTVEGTYINSVHPLNALFKLITFPKDSQEIK